MCKFSIFVMVTLPLFGTLQGPISAKCLVTDSAVTSKRHTSVFRTAICVCKILSRSVEMWQYEGQKPVWSNTIYIYLAVNKI